MDIASVIVTSMNNIGIEIKDSKEEDIDLRDFIKDSIIFISFIIELENNLDVEIPYEMLLYDKLSSFRGFCVMLEGLVS